MKSVGSGVVTSFAKIGLAIQGVQTIVNGLTSVVSTPLKLAASAEQTEVSFRVLTGSAEQANKTLDELREFGATTPFSFAEDIAPAAKKLIAFGFNANDVTGELRKLGDIGAGLGIPLGDLADIYGKARVSGRLFMEDINQLAGRGIPIQEELAKQFGVSTDKVRDLVSSGKVNFEHLQQAVSSLTGEGGKFAGLMAAQSTTLGGLWSTLKDNVTVALTEIGTGISETFDLKFAAASITSFVQSSIPTIKTWMTTFKAIFDELKPIAQQYFNALFAYWNTLSEIAGTVFNNVSSFIGQFLPNWRTMQEAMITGFVALEFGFANWRDVGEIAIKTVLANILGFAGQVQHTFTQVIPTYLGYFFDNWQHVFSEIAIAGQLQFGNLVNNLVSVFYNLPGLLSDAVDLSDVWSPITDEMTLQFKNLPDVPERGMGDIEKQLRTDTSNLAAKLGTDFKKLNDQRLAELLPSESLSTAAIGEQVTKATTQDSSTSKSIENSKELFSAAEIGTQEARSSIIRHQLGIQQSDKEKQIASNTKETNQHLSALREDFGQFFNSNETPVEFAI